MKGLSSAFESASEVDLSLILVHPHDVLLQEELTAVMVQQDLRGLIE